MTDPHAGNPAAKATKPAARAASPLWYLLLLPPFVGMLWVPFYNSVDPVVAGIPFFYWYQAAWIPVGAVLTAAVYFATREGS
jgi:hypothetical protein